MSDEKEMSPQYKSKPLTWKKKSFSYILASVLIFLIINGVLTAFSELIAYVLTKMGWLGVWLDEEGNIDKWKLYSIIAMVYFSWRLIRYLALTWRSNEKISIGTAVTDFENPFYDPNFVKSQVTLQSSYNKLVNDYNDKISLLEESIRSQNNLQNSIYKLEGRIKIMLRNLHNSNRILRSLNYAFNKGKYSIDDCLNLVLEECITVLEKDQSDKSITLFKVIDEELVVKSSVRINFESIDKRKFKKGEGFAGYIWEKNKAEIVNHIDIKDPRFNDGGLPITKIGSILGYPLTIEENEILGVFCLQSEDIEGFLEEDLVTVEMYARICTMILLYDKIQLIKEEG